MRGTETRPTDHRRPRQDVVVGGSAAGDRQVPNVVLAVAALLILAVVAAALTSSSRLIDNVDPEFAGTATGQTDPLGQPPTGWLRWDRTLTPIRNVQAETLVAVGSGFATLAGPGDGTGLWTSSDGSVWTRASLETLPFGLVTDGTDLVAFRGESLWRIEKTGAVWTPRPSVDLPTWARLGYLSHRPAVTAAVDGILVQSVDGELFTDDGSGFSEAVPAGEWSTIEDDPWEAATAPRTPSGCRPPSSGSIDYVPILSTDTGLYAFVTGGEGRPHGVWPACRPRVWTSTDGLIWTLLTTDSPFARGAYVYDVAWRKGTFLAVGGVGAERAAMWTSTDGRTWVRAPIGVLASDVAFQPTEIEAGPLGWAVLGMANDRSVAVGWASPDGDCWQRLPEEVIGRHAAVGERALAITDRNGDIWLGTPESNSAC